MDKKQALEAVLRLRRRMFNGGDDPLPPCDMNDIHDLLEYVKQLPDEAEAVDRGWPCTSPEPPAPPTIPALKQALLLALNDAAARTWGHMTHAQQREHVVLWRALTGRPRGGDVLPVAVDEPKRHLTEEERLAMSRALWKSAEVIDEPSPAPAEPPAEVAEIIDAIQLTIDCFEGDELSDGTVNCLRAAIKLLRGVPGTGWKLVPVEGSWEMTTAALTHIRVKELTIGHVGMAIAAAIAAAPELGR